MTEDGSTTEGEAPKPRIKILTPRPDQPAEPELKPEDPKAILEEEPDAKSLKKRRKGDADDAERKPSRKRPKEESVDGLGRRLLKRRRKGELEEDVERMDKEIQRLQASVKSLMCIYQTIQPTRMSEPPRQLSNDEDPLGFSQLFQCVRSLENEMDRIASIYMSDEQPSVSDHRRLDSLYQKFVDLLIKGNPQLSQSSLTLESLQDDEGIDSLGPRLEPDEGDGYRPEDEGEMLRSLRMVQQSMETLLMRSARGSPLTGKELDSLDHWYQVFASFR